MPDVVERLETQGGNEIIGNSPEEFAKVIRDELTYYTKMIKDTRVTVD